MTKPTELSKWTAWAIATTENLGLFVGQIWWATLWVLSRFRRLGNKESFALMGKRCLGYINILIRIGQLLAILCRWYLSEFTIRFWLKRNSNDDSRSFNVETKTADFHSPYLAEFQSYHLLNQTTNGRNTSTGENMAAKLSFELHSSDITLSASITPDSYSFLA